jgi:hypothetical protein
MKIAFCLSGQLRTWRNCYQSWQLLFDRFKEQMFINGNLEYSPYVDEPFEIDYFIHTWDFNTVPHFKWEIDWLEPDPMKRVLMLEPFKNAYSKIEKEEILEVLSILKPKKSIVEDWNISKTRESVMDDIASSQTHTKNPIKGHISWAGSQLYSIMRCAHLKREYELENKFEYDLCIRSRFDLNFDENNRMIFARDFEKPKPKTIYSVHSASIDRFPFDIIGDIFYCADSQTFDLLASMYDTLPHIEQSAFSDSIKIEEVMAYTTRMFLLNNKKLDFGPDVQRD